MSGIFKGLKILDFTWVIVGPMTVRYFCDQGATVVKVESANYPGPLRQSPPYKDGKSSINSSAYFAAQNTNKMSLGVDLSSPEGLEIIRKLVEWADIVAESFAPGVMEKLGLSYEELKKIKPDIIFLRMNMLGTTGPLSSARGFGLQLVAYSGFTYITGWPDSVPAQPFGPYTDWIAPRYAASALLMALIHRKKSGDGACIDLSQHEAGINFLIPMLLDRQLSGKQKERNGNVHPCFCPHGVYPCKGKERWVAICITNDEQWKDFSGLTGEDWTDNKEFASSQGRKKNEEIIDSLVSQWSREHFPEEITAILQGRRIPAGVVQNSQDLVNDPQLADRQAIWFLDHESVGMHAVFRQGFVLSENPLPRPTAAPRLGEHTYHICKEILQIPDEEIVSLLDDDILQIEV